jgi:dimethylhistidine N-methyltransferase
MSTIEEKQVRAIPFRRPRGRFDDRFAADVLKGLSRPQKSLPCTWLYDDRGSELFVEITRLDEYYPTRSEIELLAQYADELRGWVGPGATLVEFGSGSSHKTPLVLSALEIPKAYVGIDISASFLHEAVKPIRHAFPAVQVTPLVADFRLDEEMNEVRKLLPKEGSVLGFFPGSTIGNFTPIAATEFLKRIGRTLGQAAYLLIGVDSTEDEETLLPAYDDARQVTAEFNLNLLRRINRELRANFDLSSFWHEARFNRAESRIEMHLVSSTAQRIQILGREVDFEPGESIHTENSYKYSQERFRALASAAGWTEVSHWMSAGDTLGNFGIHLLRFGVGSR